MNLDLTKRYFIMGKYTPDSDDEYIIGETKHKGKNMFFGENYSRTKRTEKFYLEYSHTLEEAKRILKAYKKYNSVKCPSWYHKPILYLKRASRF